jgi:uncharacterized protein
VRFGLPEKTIEQIIACLAQYPDIEWVKVYGSRALGTYRKGSDIDLAFAGPVDHTLRLSGNFDELPTPYLFDVTYYNGLKNEKLINHIDQVGQLIFTQKDLQ